MALRAQVLFHREGFVQALRLEHDADRRRTAAGSRTTSWPADARGPSEAPSRWRGCETAWTCRRRSGPSRPKISPSGTTKLTPEGEIFGLLGPPTAAGNPRSSAFSPHRMRRHPEAARDLRPRRGAGSRPRCAAHRRGFPIPEPRQKADGRENLRGQGHCTGCPAPARRPNRSRCSERLGLTDRRNDLVATLSGGLRRRVEIAKGLLHRPRWCC